MRCKNCDYPLWQIRDRKCPECGLAFLPSEYEFTLNSVRFCCPHCAQAYYGTGDRGQLVPRTFDCVQCARRIDLDEMVLLPTEGVREEQTKIDDVPWIELGRGRHPGVRGWLSAWFKTIGMSMVKPGRLIKQVPPDAGVGRAMYFLIVSTVIIYTVAMLPMILFMGLGMGMAAGFGPAGGGGPGALQATLIVVSTFLGMVVGGIVFEIVVTMIWWVATHALLRMTGKTEYGMSRTLQALCYASGANVVSGVPCVGYYFGWIWWVVSAVLMVKDGQKVHGGRATFAVITPPIVLVIAAVGAYAGLIYYSINQSRTAAIGAMTAATAASNAGGGAAMNPQQMNAKTSRVTRALINHTTDWKGQLPPHACQLITTEALTTFDFVFIPTATAAVPVGGGGGKTLDDLMVADAREESRLVSAAAGALPPGVTAHRLGDFVFTYHGIDFVDDGNGGMDRNHPTLWLVVCVPDPLLVNPIITGYTPSGMPIVNPQGITNIPRPSLWPSTVVVGQADGSTQTFPAAMLGTMLAQQNRERAAAGLPGLVDPTTVTHAAPAVAPATESPAETPVEPAPLTPPSPPDPS